MQDNAVITVYSNSASRTFWESGIAFPFFVGVFVFLFSIVLINKVIESMKIPRFSKKRKYAEHFGMFLSIVLALLAAAVIGF